MRWTRTLLAMLVVGTISAASMAGVILRYDGGGKLAPVTAGGPEKGKCHISIIAKGSKRAYRLTLHAYKLDRTKDVSGAMPEFHVWLVRRDGEREADFGKLPTNKFGHGYFEFEGRDGFPDGISTLFELEDGGKVEVRGSDGAVLRATIGSFKRTRIGGSAGGGGY